MSTRNPSIWDGHYFTFNPLPGDIIDVSNRRQLPTRDIVVNMDGGVGGSWEEVSILKLVVKEIYRLNRNLPQNCQEPFIPDFT